MLQDKKPISFFSSEKNWAQIEKEFLAVTEAFKKCHTLLYGKKNITVYTDHKPLVALIKKYIDKIKNNRLKRLKLKTLAYTFELKYLPCKYMYIADLLNRNYISREPEEDESMKEMVHSLRVYELTATEERFQEFVKETANDEDLKKVLVNYQNG